MFDGKQTNEPYDCIATNPDKKCNIEFETGSSTKKGSVEVFCRCSLDPLGSDKGFCESVIGTDIYAKAVSAKKLLYEQSECHTLDREDMRAHRDTCGIGAWTDEWRFAVDKQFNVTHWPYVQDSNVYHCVRKFFADSYVNESLDSALFGVRFVTLAAVIATLATSAF